MILAALAAAAAVATAPSPDRIDAYINAQMARNHIPGVALAIVRDGKVEKSSVYGLANLEWGQPVDETSAFQLASSTKPLTGVLLMQLVQEGKLSLDDPISSRLPDTPPAWSAITLRQLATHTSGLPTGLSQQTGGPAEAFADRQTVTAQQVVQIAAKLPLEHAPGTTSAYGLTDFALVTAIIERATGQTYPALLDARILRPLGMASTRFDGGDDRGMGRSVALIPHRVGIYGWAGDRQVSTDIFFPPWSYSAGGLYSTAADLARFFAALDHGRLLGPAALNEMWTPARLSDGRNGEFGVGWVAGTNRGRRVAGHSGGGALSDILHFPDQKLTIIVLTNQQNMTPYLAQGVADLIAPAPAPVHAAIRDDDPALTARLHGVLDGTAPETLFTAEAQRTVLPMARMIAPMFISAHGEVRSFTLVGDRTEAGRRVRRYVTLYGDAPQTQVLHTFTLTPDGHVAAVDAQVE